MYFTTHLVVGMSLGAVMPNSMAAAAAGVASHVVLDMVSHHDYEGIKGGVFDLTAGAAAATALHWVLAAQGASTGAVLTGGLAATLPDAEVVAAYLKSKKGTMCFPTHSGLLPHNHRQLPWGAGIQFLVMGISAAASVLAIRSMA